MNFLKSKIWLITGLIILILLAAGIFVKIAFDTNLFGSEFRTLVLGYFQKNPFKESSAVKISSSDSSLNLDFNILEKDNANFVLFVKNWFGVEEAINNLKFGIDNNIKVFLSQSLPADLKLNVTEKSLTFNSNTFSGLQNPLIKNDLDFATGSSKLDVEYSDASKYHLKIENPVDLANYATSSGILTTSQKLEGLFKSLPKVATIELSVNGKNISGQIVLK